MGGNLYVRVLLGMPVHDATAGYRVYRADALRDDGPARTSRRRATASRSTSPGAPSRPGSTVVEVPITFVEREVGQSKMSRDIMTESLRLITAWGVRHRAHQVRDLVGSREPRWHSL